MSAYHPVNPSSVSQGSLRFTQLYLVLLLNFCWS